MHMQTRCRKYMQKNTVEAHIFLALIKFPQDMYLHNIFSLPFLLSLRKSICHLSIITHSSGLHLKKNVLSKEQLCEFWLQQLSMNKQRWNKTEGSFKRVLPEWMKACTLAQIQIIKTKMLIIVEFVWYSRVSVSTVLRAYCSTVQGSLKAWHVPI